MLLNLWGAFFPFLTPHLMRGLVVGFDENGEIPRYRGMTGKSPSLAKGCGIACRGVVGGAHAPYITYTPSPFGDTPFRGKGDYTSKIAPYNTAKKKHTVPAITNKCHIACENFNFRQR